jgi:hypothetical protein
VENLAAFAKIAPQLANPLVLIGFVLFLVFGIHRVLLKSRIIPTIGKNEAPRIVRLILHYGFIISILIILLGFAYAGLKYFRPDLITTYSGVLTPQATLLFSPQGGGAITKIEIGQSGTFIRVGNDRNLNLLPLLRATQFRVENVGGKIKVSSQIFDREGHLIAELVRNEWKVALPPRTWDRNYTDDALEVRDGRGLVVLQVRALIDCIQIQGLWWTDMGPPRGIVELIWRENPVGGGSQMFILSKDTADADVPPIAPIFEYPSERHLGELRTK